MKQDEYRLVERPRMSLISRLATAARSAWAWITGRCDVVAIADQEVLEDADVDSLHAWSITARLAAVPGSYLDQVPPEVAKLIREAKGLHPQMADGAAARDARGEPCPPV